MDAEATRAMRAELVLVAVLVATVAQVARVLFPIMFEIGEDWDFTAAGVVALAVFSAPIVSVPLVRLDRRVVLLAGSACAGGALVVAQFLEPIPAPAAIALVAVALAGGALVVARLDHGSARTWLVFAVLLGCALDVAVRAGTLSWDLPWQVDVGPRIVGVVLAVVLLTAAALARPEREPYHGVIEPVAFVASGAFAALQLLFLVNVGFVSSQADLAFASASAVALTGLLVGVLSCAAAPRLPWPRRSTAALGAIAVVVAWLLPTTSGAVVVVLVVALQAVLAVLLALGLGRSADVAPSPARVIGGATGGSVLFLVVVLLWQVDIDQPLPVPREAVPAVAAAVVAIVASGASLADVWTRGGEARLSAATLAMITVVVPTWLWFAIPDPDAGPDRPTDVNLVSYNVRGAVDVDGQLRPDRVALEIRSSDPDVVVLQEVGRGWPIHGTLDLLAYLSRELDMEYVFAPAADGQFGNAILSHLPMSEIASGPLPADGAQGRSYAMVELTTSTGPVIVVGTHIHTRSVPQVTALLEVVGTRTPVVVAGDMNIAPTDPEVSLFTDAGLIDIVGATGDPCRTTSAEPTSSCDRPDWVFVSPDIGIVAVRIGSAVASDHLAIHATVDPG